MDIKIKGQVNTPDRAVEITVTGDDICDLIEKKAKELGLTPKQGRLSAWFSPQINSVEITG